MLTEGSNFSQSMSHSRKNSNMSASSDDSLRKYSNDSGISIPERKDSAASLPYHKDSSSMSNVDELIGEPKLSSASMQNILARQGFTAAAAAFSPAMLGLAQGAFMPHGLGGLWGNPLAAAALMQQQQEATRKYLEMVSAGGRPKGASVPSSQYPSLFTSPPQPNPTALADAIKCQEQLISQLVSHKGEEITRKSHSFSGTSTTQSFVGASRLSPPANNAAAASPSLQPSSPSVSKTATAAHNSAEDDGPTSSLYGDDDSMYSGKSSVCSSRTPQPANHSSSDAQNMYPSLASNGLPPHVVSGSSRRRKNGIIGGSLPLPDMSVYANSESGFTANSEPYAKLSTSSLPATFSPSHQQAVRTSRKRQRNNINTDEKVGSHGEDDSYWERRRKNNEAAKRSRDSRRAKEDEIAIRAAFLEQENLRLRVEVTKLREELAAFKSEMEELKNGRMKPGTSTSPAPQASNRASPPGAGHSTGENSPSTTSVVDDS